MLEVRVTSFFQPTVPQTASPALRYWDYSWAIFILYEDRRERKESPSYSHGLFALHWRMNQGRLSLAVVQAL